MLWLLLLLLLLLRLLLRLHARRCSMLLLQARLRRDWIRWMVVTALHAHARLIPSGGRTCTAPTKAEPRGGPVSI